MVSVLQLLQHLPHLISSMLLSPCLSVFPSLFILKSRQSTGSSRDSLLICLLFLLLLLFLLVLLLLSFSFLFTVHPSTSTNSVSVVALTYPHSPYRLLSLLSVPCSVASWENCEFRGHCDSELPFTDPSICLTLSRIPLAVCRMQGLSLCGSHLVCRLTLLFMQVLDYALCSPQWLSYPTTLPSVTLCTGLLCNAVPPVSPLPSLLQSQIWGHLPDIF